MAEPANHPNIEAILAAKTASEAYQIVESVFYLYAPEGIGRSKLAAHVERYLGVPTTARNYRTVEKIVAMLNDD
jgi:uncharacterized protein (DUF1697 family)